MLCTRRISQKSQRKNNKNELKRMRQKKKKKKKSSAYVWIRRCYIHQIQFSARHQITELVNTTNLLAKCQRCLAPFIHSLISSRNGCQLRKAHLPFRVYDRLSDWVHRFWPSLNLRHTSFIHFSFDLRRSTEQRASIPCEANYIYDAIA